MNLALFINNDALIYHLYNDREENLPSDADILIKTDYSDSDITVAISLDQDNRRIWIVNLEGKTKYLVLGVEIGEIEQLESLTETM